MFPFNREKKAWRRRNYFINKEFQARFIIKFLSVTLIGSAISGYVMFLMVERDVEHTFYSSHIRLGTTGQLLLPTLLKVNFGVLAAVLLAVAIITLLITHKVAGPLYRLGRSAEKIADGDLTGSFNLRTNDELKGLARSLDTMNSRLKERFSELKAQAEDIDRAAENLLFQYAYANLNKFNEEKAAESDKIRDFATTVETFSRNMSRFKLERS